ncbi:unnamed protein product [Gongylonema pulchrum]|uniref:Protein sleepless n=1 Tax=Gongylonema pulchrum TaxID=637853 RepID=A0A183ESG7_9BILA|nr:unnamed protein product [Gongylonema pulchrum]
MRCYQCNSAEDANCDSNDPKDLRQYIKLCPLLQEGTYAGNEPIACRKIVQVCVTFLFPPLSYEMKLKLCQENQDRSDISGSWQHASS